MATINQLNFNKMTQLATTKNNQQLSTKQFFDKDSVRSKFNELLGKKSQGFITSVLQVVSSNKTLQGVSPESIYNSAAMAATLDLPINQN
jgi:recombination protein RecT